MIDFLLMVAGALFAMLVSGIVNYKKSQWVGLTDEEIKECFKITPDLYLPWQIYTRIELKLKEKNA